MKIVLKHHQTNLIKKDYIKIMGKVMNQSMCLDSRVLKSLIGSLLLSHHKQTKVK